MSRVAVREITVLGEFKPFGLTVEAEDGGETSGEEYHYFLFDSQEAKQREVDSEIGDASAVAGEDTDHEIFVRGNRIIWSAGRRVCKRFTLPSQVTKVCWCRMGNQSEAVLCVLQADSMTIYGLTGEVASIALLPHAIASIWPLPFGLLLQREAEETVLSNISLSYSNFLTSRDVYRQTRDVPCNLEHDCTPPHIFDLGRRNEGTLTSSHLILRDPLEDPQITFIAERGKSNVMCEFDERTIWTSEYVPLMVTYNKAKRQHSLWVVEANDSDIEETITKFPRLVAPGMSKKHLFRRIWQGKGSQNAASKVFLATDLDVTPVACFLLQDQKQLLSLRLESLEVDNERVYDIKPEMSWNISAITAAAVSVTRPKVKVGRLPLRDVIALTPENTVLLYSGNLCLCKFIMPPTLGEEFSSRAKLSGTNNNINDMRIVDLVDDVEGRVNIVVQRGQNYRCTMQRGPSSSLTNDCISSIAEGISSDFYYHFLSLLWGDKDSTYLSKSNSTADSEWESFCHVIRKMCRNPSTVSETLQSSGLHQSWEFLTRSKYNQLYFSRNYYIAGAFPGLSSDRQGLDASVAVVPESVNKDESFCRKLLTELLDSLHAVYETLKVDNLRKRDLGLLVVLLFDIAEFLQEVSYLDHYKRDFPRLVKELGMPHGLYTPRNPPNLLRWLETCLQHGYESASISDLPLLIFKDGTCVVNWARKLVSFYSLLCGAKQSGTRLTTGVSCKISPGLYRTREELTVLAMVGEKFGPQHLDLLPAGISLPLRHAVDKCRESPPTNWHVAAYVLVGREDLAMLHLRDPTGSGDLDFTKSSLISTAPYMLALHPVTILSSVSDTLDLEDSKLDDVDNFEGPVTDGMEHIFNSSTQLRFGRDLRLNEVTWLLCSARPVSIHTSSNLTASDQDFQQTQLWHLAQRTTALPFGRGAFTLGTICTLLTEALSVPKLVLAGRLPAQQNAMVNLDPNIRNIQELKCWPEFHNAVAAGLRISPFQGKMSKMWILYNKPDEPNATHAGLLLALGLHGHLRVLLISDIFQYYSQDHESTTVGLMIGLAASYRGTMQPSISKSLYVHLPARHPSSFPELELPTIIQSAALISLGLLYEGSAHPQTMQFLLSEIGRRSGGDNVLEREGYAVSAGFSLGLVALGHGEGAVGSIDSVVERLFQYISGKELLNDSLHPNSSHTDELNRTPGQIMDVNLVNIDVTAPGAVIALALMYLKTESELIVSRLSIPQTQFELQYVRPDFILIRVVARNLIKWSRVAPSEEWIESQIPEVITHGIKSIGHEMGDIGQMDTEAFVQAYVNIVTGACISIGLRFAGTRNGNAQDLLYKYAIYFLNEIKPVCASDEKVWPRGLSNYVDRGTLETCLHLIVLSLCVVMSGSGNLQTLKLLKFLRNRSSADGQAYFGTQMAVSLGIGFLFLGGGMSSFSTSNSSIAALLITLYPRLPNGPNDNRCHLQALRHLYVLATEARWIQTVDVDTGLPVYAPLEVTIRETELFAETSFFEVTPCVLPERAILKALCVCGPRYWSQIIELTPEDKPWWNSGNKCHPFNSGILYVKRKVGACSYVDDPIGSQSLLSRAMHKMSDLTKSRSCSPTTECTGEVRVEQLVNTFLSDPSLVAFAQLFCDSSPLQCSRTELDTQMFCLQILFECVRKDRPAMLQVYLSLYTTIESMTDSVFTNSCFSDDLQSISSLKIALAYKEALSNGILSDSGGGIIQSAFLGLLQKRVEDLLSCCLELEGDFYAYTTSGEWPSSNSCGKKSSTVLSWYLQWYNVPTALEMNTALEKIQRSKKRSSIPLLRLVFPKTHITAIRAISRFCPPSESGEDSCKPGGTA